MASRILLPISVGGRLAVSILRSSFFASNSLQRSHHLALNCVRNQSSITLFRHYSAQSNGSNVFDLETDDDFDECVLQANKPVLVQFYADWCGPCQNLSPKLEAKINGMNGEILLVRINVDASVGFIAGQFDVTSVPTVLCFQDGEIVHRFEGDVDDGYLDEVMSNLGRNTEED